MNCSSKAPFPLLGLGKGFLWALLIAIFFKVAPTEATLVRLIPVENTGTYQEPVETEISTGFKWLLVENNVGDYDGTLQDPGPKCDPLADDYPASCNWPSIRSIKALAPIYSSGDDTEFGPNVDFEIPVEHAGKFMVTVMIEGYRLSGGYFEVTGTETENIIVKVPCQRHPLPLGTIRLFVFNDTMPCNGQYDPGEEPLADFGIGINDIEGPITEDYYGNSILDIVSDENGMIVVPNMWPNRYDLDVGPPPNEGWIKTNTLEGGHGWDYWLYEGWDGFDNEFTIGGEQFPMANAGFVRTGNVLPTTGFGLVTLTGKIKTVSPWPNGLNFAEINGINPGQNVLDKGPLFNKDGMIAISDLDNSDVTVYVGLTEPDGTFELKIPPGNYMIAYFDIAQVYILQFQTFTVPQNRFGRNPNYDLGDLILTGWYTEVQGFFFEDLNSNGIYDEGEPGLSTGPFPVLRYRDGTQVDRGLQFEIPFNDPVRKGFYRFSHGYPFASWITMHVYHPTWEMTGYSYRTQQEGDVYDYASYKVILAETDEYDIAIFGTPSVATYLNVGFRPRKSSVGSIIGAVHYDTTRANLDASQAVIENHEPGIPGIKVTMYPLSATDTRGCRHICQRDTAQGFGHVCPHEGNIDANEKNQCTRYWVGNATSTKPFPVTFWASNDAVPSKGKIEVSRGQLVFDCNNKESPNTGQQSTETSIFEPPTNCVIHDNHNNPIAFGVGQSVLPDPDTTNPVPCIETPLLRNQVGGFARPDGGFKFTGLQPGYYALQIEIPLDKKQKPMYKVRTENDVNSYESDLWEGQQSTNYPFTESEPFIPPPVCPSEDEGCPMPINNDPPRTPNFQNIKTPCAGKFFTVSSSGNPTFAANGGSHKEGKQVHYCDIKIVHVEGGVASKVNFNLFTDVPIPARWKGLIIDDRIAETNPKSTLYTELRGIPHMPIGVRDFTGTMVTQVETDANGFFELLVPPSRNNANMLASAATLSAGMYCLTANDPGSPALPNRIAPLPEYRPIRACFEGMPGRITPVDLAPVNIRASMLPNGGGIEEPPCGLPQGYPQLFNVQNLDVTPSTGPICPSYPCYLTIRGTNLGTDALLPTVSLLVPDEQGVDSAHYGKTPPDVTSTSVSNTNYYDEVKIMIAEPDGTTTNFGMYQLELTNQAGHSWITGISVHLLGGEYNPDVYDTRDYYFVQDAINAFESEWQLGKRTGGIIMVFPGAISINNPEGAIVENLFTTIPVKIQGIGPGGNQVDELTRGTQLNGGGFGAGVICGAADGLFCDTQAQTTWKDNIIAKMSGRSIMNNNLVEGQVLYVLSDRNIFRNNDWTKEALTGGVDGCLITGGSQSQPANPTPNTNPGEVSVASIQGGGVTLHSYNKFYRITNNEITANSGSFGGGIRVGTAFLRTGFPPQNGNSNSENTQLTISRNIIRYNGGFNLAGGIGIFGGSKDYVIQKNYICGNSGQEYGGGISHFGVSNNGLISDNWIMWNRAVDEGGCILIASETLPFGTQFFYPDAGDVVISGNTIQGCVTGDDGGGIRFLNAGLSSYQVHDNIISHNMAMHEGGGVSINDAPFLDFYNNIVVSNIVTGTSAESNQNSLYAAGLATNGLSFALRFRLRNTQYGWDFSHPRKFDNNIFWDNRASNGEVIGTGEADSPFELQGLGFVNAQKWLFDMGSSDGGLLGPQSSNIQTLPIYYDEDTCLPTGTTLPLEPYLEDLPFACVGDLFSSPEYTSSVLWGTDLTVQVLGLTVTLAGSNTFVVSAATIAPGPILVHQISILSRQRTLVAESANINDPLEANISQVFTDGSLLFVGFLLVGLAVTLGFAIMSVLKQGKDLDLEDGGTNVSRRRGGLLRQFILSLIMGVGFQKDVVADEGGCTVDCNNFGIPIPEQIKYQTPLRIPEIINLSDSSSTYTCGDNIDMYMVQSEQDWGVKDANQATLLTPIYGYSTNEAGPATYPGPTIIASKGCPVKITYHNKLGVGPHMFPIDKTVDCGDHAPNCVAPNGAEIRTTVHLHGGHTNPLYDGHPETWFTDEDESGNISNGKYFSATGKSSSGEEMFQGFSIYNNDQAACTLFYHDHAHGITRLNVYAGLAGMYVLVDDEKKCLFSTYGLPWLNDHDIGLAFNDKMFTYDEANMKAPLLYPTGLTDAEGGDLPNNSILPEMFGYVMTVNGVIYPYLDVNAGELYLFRLLDACDSRFLRLYFETEAGERLPFTVIATDQGILAETAEVFEIPMGPAERYEIVISFPPNLQGQNVLLKNSEYTLLGPVVPGVDDQLMQFRVHQSSSASNGPEVFEGWNEPYDPIFQDLTLITEASVVNENILNDFVEKREVWITEGAQVLVDEKIASGGRPLPMLGDREHPFGLAYAAAATEILVQGKPFVWELINLSADAHVIHLHQVRFKVIDRQAVGLSYDTFQHPGGTYRQYPKNSELVEKYEDGPKDTVISYPGSVTRLVTFFDLSGLYVWHCHILSHEDNMMMRDFIVPSTIPVTEYIQKGKRGNGRGNNGNGNGNGGNDSGCSPGNSGNSPGRNSDVPPGQNPLVPPGQGPLMPQTEQTPKRSSTPGRGKPTTRHYLRM